MQKHGKKGMFEFFFLFFFLFLWNISPFASKLKGESSDNIRNKGP